MSDDKGTTPAAKPDDDKGTTAAAPEPAPMPEPDDKAPRRARVRKPRSDRGKPRGARATASTATIRKRLAEITNMVGGVVSMFDQFDGHVILSNADQLADGWAKVAERHPRIRQALDGFEAGGVYGGAIIATLFVAVPILAHHRMLPPQIAGAAAVAGVPVPTPAPSSGTGDDRPREPVERTGAPPPRSGAPVGESVPFPTGAGVPASG